MGYWYLHLIDVSTKEHHISHWMLPCLSGVVSEDCCCCILFIVVQLIVFARLIFWRLQNAEQRLFQYCSYANDSINLWRYLLRWFFLFLMWHKLLILISIRLFTVCFILLFHLLSAFVIVRSICRKKISHLWSIWFCVLPNNQLPKLHTKAIYELEYNCRKSSVVQIGNASSIASLKYWPQPRSNVRDWKENHWKLWKIWVSPTEKMSTKT